MVKKEKKISPELARVHAHLCGDGYMYFSKTNERDRKFTAVTGYCNKNQKLLEKFREDFDKLFDVSMKMRKNKEVCVRSIRIFKELTKLFGEFGCRKWRISKLIQESSTQIKLEWLKAFFEDEAYHEQRYNRLKIKFMNYAGLKDINRLLNSLDIISNITGPNCDTSFYLTIPKFDSIKEFYGFSKEPARK